MRKETVKGFDKSIEPACQIMARTKSSAKAINDSQSAMNRLCIQKEQIESFCRRSPLPVQRIVLEAESDSSAVTPTLNAAKKSGKNVVSHDQPWELHQLPVDEPIEIVGHGSPAYGRQKPNVSGIQGDLWVPKLERAGWQTTHHGDIAFEACMSAWPRNRKLSFIQEFKKIAEANGHQNLVKGYQSFSATMNGGEKEYPIQDRNYKLSYTKIEEAHSALHLFANLSFQDRKLEYFKEIETMRLDFLEESINNEDKILRKAFKKAAEILNTFFKRASKIRKGEVFDSSVIGEYENELVELVNRKYLDENNYVQAELVSAQ